MKKTSIMIIILVIPMVMITGMSVAQDTIRMSVFFAYGKSEITHETALRLDSLSNRLFGKPVEFIRITGNTDFHGSHEYNQSLSEARAKSVYDYLAGKGITTERVEILAQGKTAPLANGTDDVSRSFNRRTDIEIGLEKIKAEPLAITKKCRCPKTSTSDQLPENEPAKDKGIRLVIPDEAFLPYKNDNLNIVPNALTDMDKLSKAGFTTMTTTGDVLASAGIFSLKVTTHEGYTLPVSFTLNKPVEVWIPVTKCACVPNNVVLWDPVEDSAQNISWAKSRDSVRLVWEGRRLFYVFNVSSLATINLDCPQKTKPARIAFRHFRPNSLRLVYPRARAIIVGKETEPGIITVGLLNTTESPKVYAVAEDDGPKAYNINGKRLSTYKTNPINGKIILKRRDFGKVSPLKLKKVNKSEVIYGFVEP
ncbi:MAG: OmpA family protein [Bacteroidetes bacterium]|nr:OmpA family protein [Bacteroidota bacterium]